MRGKDDILQCIHILYDKTKQKQILASIFFVVMLANSTLIQIYLFFFHNKFDALIWLYQSSWCTVLSVHFAVLFISQNSQQFTSHREKRANSANKHHTTTTESATLAVILNDMQECLCLELFCFPISAKNRAVELSNRKKKKWNCYTNLADQFIKMIGSLNNQTHKLMRTRMCAFASGSTLHIYSEIYEKHSYRLIKNFKGVNCVNRRHTFDCMLVYFAYSLYVQYHITFTGNYFQSSRKPIYNYFRFDNKQEQRKKFIALFSFGRSICGL